MIRVLQIYLILILCSCRAQEKIILEPGIIKIKHQEVKYVRGNYEKPPIIPIEKLFEIIDVKEKNLYSGKPCSECFLEYHIYDKGIRMVTDTINGIESLIEFEIFFVKKYLISLKKPLKQFKGNVYLEGIEINLKTTPEKLKDQLRFKNYTFSIYFEEKGFKEVIRIENSGQTYFVTFEKDTQNNYKIISLATNLGID